MSSRLLLRSISRVVLQSTVTLKPKSATCDCSGIIAVGQGGIPSRQQYGRNYGSIYEPEYLDSGGPETPLYDLLNVQLKGYDFPVLESYAKYVHRTAKRFSLDVEDSWATPCKKLRVTLLKPESSIVESEYKLNMYERNVQIVDVPGTVLPMFVNVVEALLPAGVTLTIQEHLPEYTEDRYVPDIQLEDLRVQLDSMKTDKEREREKRNTYR